MGCCGRKSRSLEVVPIPKGRAVMEITFRHAPLPLPPIPVPQVVARGSMTVEKSGVVCRVCGSKLVLKQIWSSRLRRFYPVSWCANCRREMK